MSSAKWSWAAPVVAAMLVSGCLSSSQFSGTYVDAREAYTEEFEGAALLVESYEVFSYNFWGHTFEGFRWDFTLTSRLAHPVLGKITLRPGEGLPIRVLRHGEEHTIQPGGSAFVGTVWFDPSVLSPELRHQASVRPLL